MKAADGYFNVTVDPFGDAPSEAAPAVDQRPSAYDCVRCGNRYRTAGEAFACACAPVEEMDAAVPAFLRRTPDPVLHDAPATPTPADLIRAECAAVCELLLEKNRRYGNSALDPVRIFSRADPLEQIDVRIDDKLSRIRTSGVDGPDEDTLQDLIGYLVLSRVARRLAAVSAETGPVP